MSGGFSVQGHNSISDQSGLEVLKREAVALITSSAIEAGLLKKVENLDAFVAEVKRVWLKHFP